MPQSHSQLWTITRKASKFSDPVKLLLEKAFSYYSFTQHKIIIPHFNSSEKALLQFHQPNKLNYYSCFNSSVTHLTVTKFTQLLSIQQIIKILIYLKHSIYYFNHMIQKLYSITQLPTKQCIKSLIIMSKGHWLGKSFTEVQRWRLFIPKFSFPKS